MHFTSFFFFLYLFSSIFSLLFFVFCSILRTTMNEQNKQIKKFLKEAGATQAGIARELGLHITTVNQVVVGRRHTRYVRETIANAANKPYEEVWGKES